MAGRETTARVHQPRKENPKEIKAYLKDNPKPELAALSVVANAIINLDEFVTKQ
jgi:hypothetical protein